MTAPAVLDELGTTLEELDQYLTDHHLEGSWMWQNPREHPLVKPPPLTDARAFHWRWAHVYPALLASGQRVTLGPAGMTGMRTIRGASVPRAIHMNAQILMPGERTRAHQHMQNQTRLVHEAPEGAMFVCDGEAFPMGRGDLIISPSSTDHDHYNGGATPAIWIDGYDDGYQGGYSRQGASIGSQYPLESPYQEVRYPARFSQRTRSRVVAWTGHVEPFAPRPVVHYPWAEAEAALGALRESSRAPDKYDGLRLMYANPVDGGATLPTIAWHVQCLAAQLKTRAHRHNSTTSYYVFQGSGATAIDGENISWTEGDLFTVPPWTWHSHENPQDIDAILFSIDDWPAMKKLGFYRLEED